MKHWEDIVKDKLEGYEKPLPEGSIARFRNRRTAAAATPEPDHAPASKRSPLPWVLAAAAALAAVLLLVPPRNSVHPEENLLSNQHPTPPATTVADSAKVSDTENVDARQHHQHVAHTDMTNANRQNPVRPQAPTAAARPKEPTSAVRPQAQAKDEVPSAPATDDAGVGTTGLPATSPFVPEPETISGKVVPAAIGVAGSGALMGAVTAIAPLLVTKDYGYESFSNDDRLKRGPSHYMPLKMGLSVRLPIAARLSITTGVDYSLYFSRFEYVKTGTKNQTVHALSIPLRLDGTLAHNRWLDVYVGAGLEGSYCVGVHQNGYLDGQRLYKDIFDVSIVGTGGIQYNLTKQLGLYVEPQLSLKLKGQDNNLPTYRTANPLMFCVSTGFRYTFR